MKRLAFAILTIDWIGRPLRKLAFVTMKGCYKLYIASVRFHETVPYVRLLAGKTDGPKLARVAKYYIHLKNLIPLLPLRPKISVLIPVYKVKVEYFEEALRSITQQVYPNWEICIVDDCSGMPEITRIIDKYRAAYPDKIKATYNQKNLHISLTSNECLKLATGDYVALLDHDDRLYPNSLAEVVRYINLHSGPDIMYSDERTVTGDGDKRNLAYFKPDWSPFMHLCMNYTTHLSVYRTDLLRKIGGFRQGFEGSQDHDLMLRAVENTQKPVVHIPLCLYQWRAHEASTASSIDAKPYAAIAGEKAVTEALKRRGRPCKVEYEPHTQHYRLKFELSGQQPLVSIVIPSKDSYNLIQTCLESIFDLSTYRNFEIIISDNGSQDPKCLALYDQYSKSYPTQFKLVKEEAAFNFGRQINKGAAHSSGDYLLFLNNDTKVITPSWIEEMLTLAQFEEVGAVGCKLVDQNEKLQHGGILAAGRTIAVHAGNFLDRNHNLYCNVLNTIHETMAVTGACLMIQRAKFLAVGGFDEVFLPNGYGDIELCLKLRDRGYTHLYTPYAELYHYESPSRGIAIEHFERFYLMQRRGQDLLADPYQNPNLQMDSLYSVDPFYLDLDLNREEFEFFLNHEQKDWVSLSLGKLGKKHADGRQELRRKKKKLPAQAAPSSV
ncbi:glycosyltransferase family 2 protein [Oligoflexus tunisiensis]|uniref:glycosyltransferase family 2 protein n=1 Tax=Oligoflexus tunisiensis TaxID=708132 RepID=UPI00114CD347|nr:glycosyltransferase family 2 protein [Oligoflexus tunisiensis]